MEWKIFDTQFLETLGEQLKQVSSIIGSCCDITEQTTPDTARLQTLLLLSLEILNKSQQIVEDTQMFCMPDQYLILPAESD